MWYRSRRGRWAIAVWALALPVAALSGCGAKSGAQMPAAAGSPSGTATAAPSSGAVRAATDPVCTRATKVVITETVSGMGDRYAFSPAKVTIMKGGYLAIVNNSDEPHALVATPDAGMVSTVIDKGERQVVQFPQAGQFSVQSVDPKHRAVLQLTVSGDSGCGTTAPVLTIDQTGGGYAFSPATLHVQPTANFAVTNNSDAVHTITCTPDPGGNRDNSTLDKGETQILAFDKPGSYACTSKQHSTAKVTIVVGG
jgi:plastocyanin